MWHTMSRDFPFLPVQATARNSSIMCSATEALSQGSVKRVLSSAVGGRKALRFRVGDPEQLAKEARCPARTALFPT